MLVTVTVEERSEGPTITITADGQATVRVSPVKRVGDLEARTEFQANLPDEQVYPPLIP